MPVDHGQPVDARMPGLLGCQTDDKLHPAVCKLRMRCRPLDHDDQLPLECPIDIGGAQLTRLFVPGTLQVASTDQPPPPDVEDVGKIRLDGDLEDQPHRVGRVVDEVVVLMNTLENRAVQSHTDGALFEDHVVLGAISGARQRQLRAGELPSRGEVVDWAGVEQQRHAPVDRQRVAGHEARIARKEPNACRRHHSAVGLADQELMVVVDRDGGHAVSDRHLRSEKS